MKFNLINIRTASSRNGFSMSCTLVINTTKVCNFIDKGDGSMPSFEVLDTELYNIWVEGVSQIGEVYVDGIGEVEVDTAMFIDLLHYAMELKSDVQTVLSLPQTFLK